MFTDVKITTELLYKGALIFALMHAIYLPRLARGVNKEAFHTLRGPLMIAAALVPFGIRS